MVPPLFIVNAPTFFFWEVVVFVIYHPTFILILRKNRIPGPVTRSYFFKFVFNFISSPFSFLFRDIIWKKKKKKVETKKKQQRNEKRMEERRRRRRTWKRVNDRSKQCALAISKSWSLSLSLFFPRHSLSLFILIFFFALPFSFVPTGNAVYISGRRPMREIEKKGNKSVVVVVVVASPPTPSYPSQSWRKFFFHYYYVYIRRFFPPRGSCQCGYSVPAAAALLLHTRPGFELFLFSSGSFCRRRRRRRPCCIFCVFGSNSSVNW